MKKKHLILIIISLLYAAISCNDKTSTNLKDINSNELVEIKNSWMSPAAKNRNSAAYFTIANNSEVADTLYEVSSELSQVTELHETYEIRDDMLGMRSVEFVIVPANSTLDFSPGGFHIMLIGLINELPINASGKITLKFKKAGTLTISVVSQVSQN